MAFPQTPLAIKAELYLNGTWTDITSDVYTRDQINITRGRSDEARQVDPGRCALTLNNRSGKYSPRNPTGPYYGQIGRNTPIRIGVNSGAAYLGCTGGTALGTGATTPDAAALDITGDIDVRIEATLDNWVTYGSTSSVDLMGKFLTTGGQRSWLLQQRDGGMHFEWSTNGVTTIEVNSTAKPVVPANRRIAWRVTLDVDNGLGGYTVTFYTSTSISGTWTQLEQVVTTAGTTSIFSSTAPVLVGDGTNINFVNPSGAVHAAEIRNGIGGAAVANPDFTVQTPGAASFADSTGKTWTIGADTSISNRITRFTGEVPAWPVEWDTSGRDVYTRIEAAGILRRLGQGASPIQSAMRREFSNPSRTAIMAYWPCEDGAAATAFASAHAGEPSLTYSGTVSPASYTGWASSDALPTFGAAGAVRGYIPSYTATDYMFLRLFVYVPSAVAATVRLVSVGTTGTARTWSVFLDASGNMTLKAYDSDGVEILNSGAIAYGMNGKRRELGVELSRNGTGIDWRIITFEVDSTTTLPFTGTLASRTIGRATQVRMGEDGGLDGIAFGHIAVASSNTAYQFTGGAMLGWTGETAPYRITRLSGEEGVPVFVYGLGDQQLGAQKSATLVSLLQEAADSDHGILHESRTAASLAYRDRAGLYNQTPVAVLNYVSKGHIMPPLRPVDDDQQVRNDVTVSRIDGSSGRYTLTTGPLSVNTPPTGVGRYPDTPSLSLNTDDQPYLHAGWLVHLGTVDEPRYPVVKLSLQAATSLIDTVATIDSGTRIQITNPSSKLPPGTIDLMVQGYTETLSQYQWDLSLNCTPASPYTVAVTDDTTLGHTDTDGSQLNSGATSTATSLSVAVTSGPLWSTAGGDYPVDILVAGERMTVTAVSGAASPQTFTVTRSVNGVVKAQSSGAAVVLYQPANTAL